MPQSVRDVMTPNPTTCDASDAVSAAAKAMRDKDIGDVIVCTDSTICGIVTDRDIAVRVVAEGRDPAQVKLGDICSRELTTLRADDAVGEAVRLMRERSVRRLPVVDGDHPIGIVSIGDLAIVRDPDSALADISAAPANA